MAAAGCAFSLAGCDSAGPVSTTRDVSVNSMRTFAIYGGRDANGFRPLADGPAPGTVAQAVRESLEARGYRYQADSPDFYLVVTWQKTQPAAPGYESEDLNIVANDRANNAVLWWSPVLASEQPQPVTEANARTVAQSLLRNFPPAQESMVSKAN